MPSSVVRYGSPWNVETGWIVDNTKMDLLFFGWKGRDLRVSGIIEKTLRKKSAVRKGVTRCVSAKIKNRQ
jgi:hypothetical protein